MGRKSDAKERLLRVAFDLIWQQSYGSVSVEDICDRAKVKKGSFYYFFPSKSDLAVACYEEHWQQGRPNYDRMFSSLVPPFERIENYCKFIYERQLETFQTSGRVLGCPFACAAAELSTQDEKIRQKAQEMFSRKCKYVETTLRDAHKEGLIEKTDFAAKAQAVCCFMMGTILQAKVQNNPEVLRDLFPNILQMIGVAVPA
jgi:TetR/AcrR family transcriptional repressor of nem operon